MMDVTRGQPRVRIWPPPRKTRPTQAEIDQRYAFKEAVRTAKRWPADQQAKYREAVAGTALLPTDLIMMTIYGNAFAIRLDGEKVLYSMQTRAKVSESLDVINQQPNSMLLRGDTYWDALELGDPGQYLKVTDDGLAVEWVTVPTPIYFAAAGSFHWNGAAIVTSHSMNVASIVRAAPGIYTVTMTTAMSDTNYMVFGGGRWPNAGDSIGITVNLWRQFVPTTTQFQLQTFYNNNQLYDPDQVFFQVIDLGALGF